MQVLRKHDPIVVAKGWFGTTQINAQNRDAPPGQPAGHPMHDHPEGEIGERAARFVTRLINDNFGQALLAHQAGLHVLKHQRQKGQRGFQACAQCRLAHAGTAHERQAATAQTARVHREEFVVAAPGQQRHRRA